MTAVTLWSAEDYPIYFLCLVEYIETLGNSSTYAAHVNLFVVYREPALGYTLVPMTGDAVASLETKYREPVNCPSQSQL